MARKGYVASSAVVNGKRIYCYGKDKAEADRKLARRTALIEAKVKEYTDTTSVAVWADKWLVGYKEGVVSDAWYNAMKGIIENYIVPCIGDMAVKDVKPIDIVRMYNRYSYLSDSYGKKLVQITRQIFDSAEENDLMDKSPARHVKSPLWAKKRPSRPITESERSLTLKVANDNLDCGLFFLIMLYCGLRPQEVSVLTMADVDRRTKTLRVNKARKTDGTIGRPKSDAGVRYVPVPDKLFNILIGLGKRKDERIVTSATGRPLTRTTEKRMWQRFKRKMDIANGAKTFRGGIVESTIAEDLTPYCYRHTYCTDLQDAGVPVTTAKELMGHSDIRVTANIYTHHSDKSYEDAREKINKFHESTH